MRHIKNLTEALAVKLPLSALENDSSIHELRKLCDKYYAIPSYKDSSRKNALNALDEFVELFGTVFGDINHSIDKWVTDEKAKQLIRDFKKDVYYFHVEFLEFTFNTKHTPKVQEFFQDGWSIYASEGIKKYSTGEEIIFYKKKEMHRVLAKKSLKSLNQKTGLFENVKPLIADFSVFEDLFIAWKNRYLECIEIVKKYNYRVIQERLDPRYTFKIRLILEYQSETEDLQNFHNLYNRIENLKSINMEALNVKIISICNSDAYDIQEHEKSKKLKHLNNKTGLFESLKRYVHIDIYIS
jgi:hypothetical protein